MMDFRFLRPGVSKLYKWNRERGIRRAYQREINMFARHAGAYEVNKEQTNCYIERWKVLDPKVGLDWFRTYSAFLGYADIDIVPDYLYHAKIEPILNNYNFNCFAEEKNYYDLLYPEFRLPATLMRNINGIFLNAEYQPVPDADACINSLLHDHDALLVKPSIESGSGHNIRLFRRNSEKYFTKDAISLNKNSLDLYYKKDYVVQEYKRQSPVLEQFNPDSVNTLRILTYRSVSDNQVYILHTILRFGRSGCYVDNTHAGGQFCAVAYDGTVQSRAYNDRGEVQLRASDDPRIPNYTEVLNFARRVASGVYHSRVLSLDIMIDSNNCPCLIEINAAGQGLMFFQLSTGSLFGRFTDEVIAYCKTRI